MANRITESELKKFCFFKFCKQNSKSEFTKRRVFNSDSDFRLNFDEKNQNFECNFVFFDQNSDFWGENQNFFEIPFANFVYHLIRKITILSNFQFWFCIRFVIWVSLSVGEKVFVQGRRNPRVVTSKKNFFKFYNKHDKSHLGTEPYMISTIFTTWSVFLMIF